MKIQEIKQKPQRQYLYSPTQYKTGKKESQVEDKVEKMGILVKKKMLNLKNSKTKIPRNLGHYESPNL